MIHESYAHSTEYLVYPPGNGNVLVGGTGSAFGVVMGNGGHDAAVFCDLAHYFPHINGGAGGRATAYFGNGEPAQAAVEAGKHELFGAFAHKHGLEKLCQHIGVGV